MPTITGTEGNDAYAGTPGDDIINTLGGNDTVFASGGNDQVDGGAGNDFLRGQGGDDILIGGDGNDELYGGPGNDVMDGGAGDDVLHVRNDMFQGNDLSAGDQFIGGIGYDTLWFDGDFTDYPAFDISGMTVSSDIEALYAEIPLRLTLAQLQQFQDAVGMFVLTGSGTYDLRGDHVHDSTIFLGDGNDVVNLSGNTLSIGSVSGGGGRDRLIGSEASDSLSGEDGNDQLEGRGGDDMLFGGAGNDRLMGGAGNDTLTGGNGRDTFVIGLNGGQDVINDFQFGYDKIDLTAYGFTSFDEIKARMTMVGADIFIDLGGGNLLKIWSVHGDLLQSDPINLLAAEDFVGFTGGYEIGPSIIPALPARPTVNSIPGTIEIDTDSAENLSVPFTIGDGETVYAYDTAPFLVRSVGTGYVSPLINYGVAWNDVPVDTDIETRHLLYTVTNIGQGNSVRGFENYGTMVLFNGRDTVVNAIASDQTGFVNTGSIYVINEGLGNAWFNRSNLTGGTNSGLIVVQSQHHWAFGLDWANPGVFENTAGAQLLVEGYLLTIAFYGDRGGDIVNAGMIRAHSLNPANASFGLYFGYLDPATVNNSGLIQADIAIYSEAMVAIDNSGSIIGDIYLSDEDDIVESGSGTIDGYVDMGGGVDRYVGGSNDDYVFGGAGNDTLIGNAGNDILDGGEGADTMTGGKGDDIYGVDDVGDVITEGANAGYDAVFSSISYTLGANLEELDLLGAAAVDGTGNASGNVLVGNAGNNVLSGLEGNDVIEGGAGDDRMDGGTGFDMASYTGAAAGVTVSLATSTAQNTGGAGLDTLANLEGLFGSDFADRLTGNAGINILYGLASNDLLDGGGAVDQLDGGEGGDIYLVRNAADHTAAEIDDTGSNGTDEVRFAATVASTLTLFAGDRGIERVVIGTGTGSSAVTSGTVALNVNAAALGNALVMIGNNGANLLTGTAFNDTLTGLAGDDILRGGLGNDTLDGGVGVDKMYGGVGDDTYIVSDATDYTYEYAGEGTDLVLASVTTRLRDFVENLTLTGSGNIYGTGNDLANVITGNNGSNRLYGLDGDDTLYGLAGNDTLYGGVGTDHLYGGIGNDVYSVGDAGDIVHENGGEGTDTVYSFITYTLTANVERLYLVGSEAIDATGNSGANILKGNEADNVLSGGDGNDLLYGYGGNDTLVGGAGVDKMYGREGDDTYIVSDSTDFAYEAAGQGTDTVLASVTCVLRDHVEVLTLTGTDAINGYGNGQANILTGNDAANLLAARAGDDQLSGLGGDDILYGEDGNDLIAGGAGRDRAYGGSGSDTFIFADGDFGGADAATADIIHDFSQSEGDHIDLSAVDANTGLGGNQAFSFIGSAAFSNVAGQLRTEVISGNTYVMGDTDGDGTADFWIRLDGLHTLSGGDFIL